MRFISIDPGTIRTGLVLWDDDELHAQKLISYPQGWETLDRMKLILADILATTLEWDVGWLAVERPPIIPDQLAPELNVLYRQIRRTARRRGWRFDTYNPSEVVAAVRPRGFPGRTSKEQLRIGVQMLYGWYLGKLDQNIIDAIAVGHCHIGKIKKEALLG